MLVSNYSFGNSNIHNMHPLSKIICFLLFFLALIFTHDFALYLILFLLTIIIVMNTSIDINVFIDIFKNIKWILLVIFIFFSIISFSFVIGVSIVFKLILLIVYLSVLTITTPTTEIIYGLETLLKPLKQIKGNVIALNIGFALKFIPMFLDEKGKIEQIKKIRKININIVQIMKQSWSITLRRIKEYKQLMTLRLYATASTRTNYRINKWVLFDTFLVFLHVFIVVAIVVKGVIL